MKHKILLLFYVVLVIVINVFFVGIVFVDGNSMEDTYHDGDLLFLLKWNYEAENGDVIVTDKNNITNTNLIKRVVATGGQKIEIYDGSVVIDGILLEGYSDITVESPIDLVVPTNSVFLIGDNYKFSVDSREIGVIKTDNILGRVF